MTSWLTLFVFSGLGSFLASSTLVESGSNTISVIMIGIIISIFFTTHCANSAEVEGSNVLGARYVVDEVELASLVGSGPPKYHRFIFELILITPLQHLTLSLSRIF